eukprot:CAMPEP_0194509764 /NCGR_PEP_ID=MMETSP0253-20130528/40817_1 /TAXON_ID=2966 /ORGANISM="Noctiluca scintillans" /LENGTH=186 /DNA_ID=CAMNT_0039352951 /DNA_START=105 /DNA_END=662 /DNA_ORIENTATION=-
MIGPPPPQLEHRFRQLRLCVWGMVWSVVFKIIAGVLLNRLGSMIYSVANLVNVVIGTFLMRDDPTFKNWHRCLTTTCFSSCQDQLQGGKACLVPWIVVNALFAVIQVIWLAVLENFTSLVHIGDFHPNVAAGILFFFSADLIALVSEIVGAVVGYLAYRDAVAAGLSRTPEALDVNASLQLVSGSA